MIKKVYPPVRKDLSIPHPFFMIWPRKFGNDEGQTYWVWLQAVMRSEVYRNGQCGWLYEVDLIEDVEEESK